MMVMCLCPAALEEHRLGQSLDAQRVFGTGESVVPPLTDASSPVQMVQRVLSVSTVLPQEARGNVVLEREEMKVRSRLGERADK